MSILSLQALHCHGSNNQFILIDESELAVNHLDNQTRSSLSRLLCNSKEGFSVDGVLFCNQSDFAYFYDLKKQYDATMRMFNPDGSEAEMCGNGLRCAGRYNIEKKQIHKTHIATPKDVLTVSKGEDIFPSVSGYDSQIGPLSWRIDSMQYAVNDSGSALISAPLPLLDDVLDSKIRYTAASIPNPHLIGISPIRLSQEKIVKAWEKLSGSSVFPQGINLSIVTQLENDEDISRIFVMTCERGVGPTDACGTAMAASSAVAASHTNWVRYPDSIEVFNLGGMVICDAQSELQQDKVLLRGNATWVKQMQIDVDLSNQQMSYRDIKAFSEEGQHYLALRSYAQQVAQSVE